jgi:hypothetical protein
MSLFELISSNRFASSLLGIREEKGKETTFSYILLASSVFLGLASLYTTFWGISQYVHWIVAIFIALGLNGLLFVTSWRIGVDYISETLRPSMAVVFIITLTISVFFSYSALLDTIYNPKARNRDELHRAKMTGEQITSRLSDLVYKVSDYNSLANHIRSEIDKWHNTTVETYSGPVAQIRARNSRNIERYNGITSRLSRLKSQVSTDNSRKSISRLENLRNQIASNDLIPVANQIEQRVDPSKEAFDTALKNFLQSDNTLTLKNYNEMVNAFKKYFGEISQESKSLKVIEIPKEIGTEIEILDQTNAFLSWQRDSFGLIKKESIEDVRVSLFEYLSILPKSVVENPDIRNEVQGIRSEIDEIGKYGGENVHPFVLAVGELSNSNYLAVGSLVIALFLDGLVLLCGLVGARPASYLTMKKTHQLDNSLETGLSLLLSLNLANRADLTDPFISRIVTILNQCSPDVESAQKKGMPVFIGFEKIDTNGLKYEIGILIAAGLAIADLNQKKVWLKLRLILWFAEQIKKFDRGEKTANFNNVGDTKS